MIFLEHRDAVPGKHVYEVESIPAVEQRGARGGRRVPVAVIWRPHGTSLFALSRNGVTLLWPWVQWHSGDGRARYMRAEEWIARHGSAA